MTPNKLRLTEQHSWGASESDSRALCCNNYNLPRCLSGLQSRKRRRNPSDPSAPRQYLKVFPVTCHEEKKGGLECTG